MLPRKFPPFFFYSRWYWGTTGTIPAYLVVVVFVDLLVQSVGVHFLPDDDDDDG
jgi:hypothetical protein